METRDLKLFFHLLSKVTLLKVKNWVGHLVLHNFVL